MALPKATLRIVGQYGLLIHPDALLAQVSLIGTVDVDALVQAEYFIFQAFKDLLEREGLEYDEDSEKIWLPPVSTFTQVFSSSRLECEVLDPLFSLTSKAIKAKEKNRILIRNALKVYGKKLCDLIEKYGGDCAYFK